MTLVSSSAHRPLGVPPIDVRTSRCSAGGPVARRASAKQRQRRFLLEFEQVVTIPKQPCGPQRDRELPEHGQTFLRPVAQRLLFRPEGRRRRRGNELGGGGLLTGCRRDRAGGRWAGGRERLDIASLFACRQRPAQKSSRAVGLPEPGPQVQSLAR